jgi:hypothetical protein
MLFSLGTLFISFCLAVEKDGLIHRFQLTETWSTRSCTLTGKVKQENTGFTVYPLKASSREQENN